MRQARTRISPERPRFTPERALLVAAAVILIVGTQMPVTSHLSPKTGIGYALGIVGGSLLLLQTVYALRSRKPSFRLLILLGIVAPLLILIHCGFSLGATNSNIALAAMLLVTVSGIFGRLFYAKVHRGPEARKATLAELQRRAQEIKECGSKPLMMPELVDRLGDEERRLLSAGVWRGPGLVLAPFTIATRYASGERELREHARAVIHVAAARHKAIATQRDRFEHVAFDYISRRLRATREIADFRVYERLLSIWYFVHVPLFLILVAAAIVHVVSVHVY